MLKNYIKIAFRNLTRNIGFTFLNITGLVVGMAGAMLIMLWINREMSVDRFHEKGEQIYQAWNRAEFEGETWCWNTTPKPLAPVLYSDYPEIISYVRYLDFDNLVYSIEDKQLNQMTAFADSTFFQMFSFPLLKGDSTKVFSTPNSAVITESTAERLFGHQDVIGQVFTAENSIELTITGIMKNLPENTLFDFDVLVPWSLLVQLDYADDYWGNNSIKTFVELEKNVNIDALNKKVETVTRTHSDEDTDVFLYPLKDVYLYSKFENGEVVGGRIDNVKMFGLIAIFILIVACINFMNLSTARSEKRAKEVGVRKLSGARKEMLIAQFILESVIMTFISGLLAIVLVQLLLPSFNTLINSQLSIPFSSVRFWLFSFCFALLTGFLAGSYPAFYLSAFSPSKVLKGNFRKAQSFFAPRKMLVISQFTFAIILIASTIIIRQQIKHAQNREKGYNQSQLIYHSISEQMLNRYEAFKNDLTQQNKIESITRTFSPITQGWSNTWRLNWEGKNPESKIVIDRFSVDENATKTLGLTLLQGRDIDISKYTTDSLAVLLNEEAVRIMGFEEPIGQLIDDGDDKWHVVGVVKNFLMGSPFAKEKPIIIQGPASWFNVFHIRLREDLSTKESLTQIEGTFKKHFPDYPFEYQFVDEAFSEVFVGQERIAKLTSIFSTLAIIISCLGLFGLSAYAAAQRSKEIGVRKVLGASVSSILILLSSDFVKLVLIAIGIATPISWYIMGEWLSNFEYRTSISVDVFIVTALIALSIAILTVIGQAYKTANINPVNSLKDE